MSSRATKVFENNVGSYTTWMLYSAIWLVTIQFTAYGFMAVFVLLPNSNCVPN